MSLRGSEEARRKAGCHERGAVQLLGVWLNCEDSWGQQGGRQGGRRSTLTKALGEGWPVAKAQTDLASIGGQCEMTLKSILIIRINMPFSTVPFFYMAYNLYQWQFNRKSISLYLPERGKSLSLILILHLLFFFLNHKYHKIISPPLSTVLFQIRANLLSFAWPIALHKP